MELREAIDSYHGLLTPDVARETQAQLDDQLRRRGLFFGARPLTTVLRPRFLTPAHYRHLQAALRPVLAAFDKAYRAALADAGIRAQFGLTEREEELIQADPGFAAPSPTGRLDTFYLPETGELKLVEYNAETPAAPAYNDALSEVFLALPVMRRFLRRYQVRPLPARHFVLHELLDAYERWGRDSGPPRIAVLDWREVPTYSEHLLFVDYFRAQGVEALTADPRAVEYRDGKLYADDLPVNLIYKRVLINELVDRGGLDHPVVRAVREGAVCMVNPFRCKLLHKKASLAVLSDERNAALFSGEERVAIAAHIPWTRRVAERHTEYEGREVDLVPFILERRERLVLKSNDEYGGKGIVLGWQTAPEDWERVAVPSEPYPSLIDGALTIFDRIQDTAPFVHDGAYVDGCLTRLSTEALVNVTAGGGSTVPTLLVEER